MTTESKNKMKGVYLGREQVEEICESVSSAVLQKIQNYKVDTEDQLEIVMLCTLKGAVPFFYEIQKKISHRLHFLGITTKWKFVKITSYQLNKRTKQIDIQCIDDTVSLRDAIIFAFEDIIDSGNTLRQLTNWLFSYNPKSVEFVSFLSRFTETELPKITSCNYILGHVIDKEVGYVTGFGLDDDETCRGLPYVMF